MKKQSSPQPKPSFVNPKIDVVVRDGLILIEFPVVDGLSDWASDDISAKFEASYPKTKRGWAYTLPATEQNAARITMTAPLELNADDAFKKIAGEVEVFDFFRSEVESGVKYPQPAKRVFDLWDHQLIGYHFAQRRKLRAMLAMGMGTGKSYTTISLLRNEAECRSNLIVCPPNVLGVWRRELRKYDPEAEFLILDDSFATVRKKREAAQRFYEASRFSVNAGRRFFVCINYESARIKDFAAWATSVPWDAGVLDEIHWAKDANGVTGKFIAALRRFCRIRLGLTGTPIPHSPADLFAQFRYLDPSIFGDNFFPFKKRYAITGFHTEILGWRRKPELRKKFQEVAIYIPESVLNLPPVQHLEREFTLPDKVMRIYREIWTDFISEVRAGRVVTVDNALVKLIRCAQITSGFVPVDEDADPFSDELPEDRIEVLHTMKRDLLKDFIRDLPAHEPLVVFCRHRFDLSQVRAVTEEVEFERNGVKQGDTAKRDAKIAAGEWKPLRYGEVSGLEKCLTEEAKLPDDRDVIGVQIKSGGVGVDFTRAAIAILYSIDYSLGNYQQMLKRLDRPGQTRPVRFYHFVAKGTVDRKIINTLNSRQKVVESIIGDPTAWATLTDK